MSHWQKRYTVKSRFEGWKSRLHSWRQDLQSIWILNLRLSFLFFIFFFLSFPPFLLFFSLSLPPLPFFSLSFLSFYCEVQFCFYHWRERTTSPCWHCRFKERTVASTPCLKPSVSWGGVTCGVSEMLFLKEEFTSWVETAGTENASDLRGVGRTRRI